MSKSTHKAIRVYITERCNANCPNCFNANNRMNKEMSLSDFTDLCKYLKKNGFDVNDLMLLDLFEKMNKDKKNKVLGYIDGLNS